MKRIFQLAAVILLLAPFSANAQSFSCPFGKNAACLDYSDKVCDGYRAKCVSSDAQCFDSYTCFPGGFVCKSKLDEAVSEYDSLVYKHNALVRDANDYQSCVIGAATLEEARSCSF